MLVWYEFINPDPLLKPGFQELQMCYFTVCTVLHTYFSSLIKCQTNSKGASIYFFFNEIYVNSCMYNMVLYSSVFLFSRFSSAWRHLWKSCMHVHDKEMKTKKRDVPILFLMCCDWRAYKAKCKNFIVLNNCSVWHVMRIHK
jgi:hypothetical protein